jgi:hypothetical protein
MADKSGGVDLEAIEAAVRHHPTLLTRDLMLSRAHFRVASGWWQVAERTASSNLCGG